MRYYDKEKNKDIIIHDSKKMNERKKVKVVWRLKLHYLQHQFCHS